MIASERGPLERGLTSQEAGKRVGEFGPNALPEPARVGQLQRWLSQFESPLIYILLFALILDLGLWLWEGADRLPLESIAIGLILILITGPSRRAEMARRAELARQTELLRRTRSS